MENKTLVKDMIVLWMSVTALLCASVNMQITHNMLETKKEKSVKESDNEETTI